LAVDGYGTALERQQASIISGVVCEGTYPMDPVLCVPDLS
jgi:hypothetical protein